MEGYAYVIFVYTYIYKHSHISQVIFLFETEIPYFSYILKK